MIRRILAAVESDATIERLIPWIRNLVPRPELHLLKVFEPVYEAAVRPGIRMVDPRQRSMGERLLQEARRRLGISARIHVAEGFVAPTILRIAQDVKADLIGIVSRVRGEVGRRLFGGATERLLYGSEIPMLSIPSWPDALPDPQIRRILVPMDGSEFSEMVLPLARSLALAHSAELVFAHVRTDAAVPRPQFDMERRLQQLVERLRAESVQAVASIRTGRLPTALILVMDETRPNLVVMGVHGLGATERLLMGSTASALLRDSPIPILAAKYKAMKSWVGQPGFIP
ncbi:MAG TPA: universal stress protein [Planctomycetota bacterium]|nr:universal stress protein [Planctomycetota bacterium]